MARLMLPFLFAFSAGVLSAELPISRANVEIDAARGSSGRRLQGRRVLSGTGVARGRRVRLHRNLIAEGGWTGAWMATYYNCSRFGCSHSRLENKLLDYGVRGVLPVAGGRLELSLGVGGGFIWFDPTSGDNYFYNGFLFQYSGKAAVALDHYRHWRMNFIVRAWRDLGRPIQQWLSTAAGISYGFGTVR